MENINSRNDRENELNKLQIEVEKESESIADKYRQVLDESQAEAQRMKIKYMALADGQPNGKLNDEQAKEYFTDRNTFDEKYGADLGKYKKELNALKKRHKKRVSVLYGEDVKIKWHTIKDKEEK